MSAALALIAHDLKNALGVLEAELGAMAEAPTPEQAQSALLHCGELRREFVQFLTLYGAETDGLRALCEDDAPLDVLQALQRAWQVRLTRSGTELQIHIEHAERAPAYWYFDRRIVQLALDAAVHNATRFARTHIALSTCVQDAETGKELVWQIRDDGPGLNADDACDHSTGLGTSLCEAVARAHALGARHGQVSLRPGEQGGALFEMRLP
jgi:signal transduction histidine kinase